MGERGSVKAWLLAFVIAFPAGLGLLVGVGCALGANTCPFSAEEPFTTTDGQEIWVARCAVCHGIDGAGSGRAPHAPSLVAGSSAELDLTTLIDRIGRGSAGLMPRFRSSLTDEQIEAVAEYVVTLRGGPDE